MKIQSQPQNEWAETRNTRGWGNQNTGIRKSEQRTEKLPRKGGEEKYCSAGIKKLLLKGQTPWVTSQEGMFGHISGGWRITGREGQLEKRKHSFGSSLSDQTDSSLVSASSTFAVYTSAKMEQLFNLFSQLSGRKLPAGSMPPRQEQLLSCI